EVLAAGAAGDVAEQGAERGFDRRRRKHFAAQLCGGEARGENAHRRTLDIAFAAGDLAGEADVELRLEAQLLVEQPRRVDETVAMDPAKPGELSLFEARDGAEDSHLLAVLQLGLEPDHVPQRAERIVLAQLDDGVGPAAGARVVEADALHGAVAKRLRPALRHDLDRHAAFEIWRVLLPVVEGHLLAVD